MTNLSFLSVLVVFADTFGFSVDPSLFERTIRSACESAIKHEPEITAADTIAGDGDCGITIANGAKGDYTVLYEAVENFYTN